MVDKSVRFVAAACLRKAQSYANQTHSQQTGSVSGGCGADIATNLSSDAGNGRIR